MRSATSELALQGLRGSRKLKPGALSLYVGDGHRAAVEAIGSYHLNGIFEIDLSNSNTNDSSMYAVSNKRSKTNLDSTLLWHYLLRHISKKRIEKLQHDGLLNSTNNQSFDKCVSCMSGNMARKPYTHQVERAKDLLVIMEYLVKVSKRRAFWSLNEYILKITILKTNTPYPSRKIRRICACTHQRPQKNKAQYVVSRETQYAIFKIRHFKTLSLDELRSPDLNLLSGQEYSEEEEAEAMAETMEQYMSKTRTDYGSGILDSRGTVPTKTATNAKMVIQDMTEYLKKWHNGTSRGRSTETSNGMAAIQAQLNNLGREIKKVKEKFYAAQVGREQCKGSHYTKDCPLKEEGKTLEEAYYTQFDRP
ncbi:zinc finger, CCHC-type containing protein [Tanacetum coccineum]